ncbi:hypothetical protein PYCCODRAFT_1120343 [Trametes coccinea BRFM310]|uniref:Secreted protein n=1 Tax=Trametes coccinea (strain BRFM310) TaxID=1353009 RepID=A0A1Y2IC98_TRAC3|nr:hypothetical protein PYCCODRAFT_1120343 [Trametes coccinea BRFM310]
MSRRGCPLVWFIFASTAALDSHPQDLGNDGDWRPTTIARNHVLAHTVQPRETDRLCLGGPFSLVPQPCSRIHRRSAGEYSLRGQCHFRQQQ